MVDLGPNSISTLSQASQYQNDQSSQSNLFSGSSVLSESAKSVYPQSRQTTPQQQFSNILKSQQQFTPVQGPTLPVTVLQSRQETPRQQFSNVLQTRQTVQQPTLLFNAQSNQPTIPKSSSFVPESQQFRPAESQQFRPAEFTPLKQDIVSSAYPSADTSRGPYIPTIQQSELQLSQQTQPRVIKPEEQQKSTVWNQYGIAAQKIGGETSAYLGEDVKSWKRTITGKDDRVDYGPYKSYGTGTYTTYKDERSLPYAYLSETRKVVQTGAKNIPSEIYNAPGFLATYNAPVLYTRMYSDFLGKETPQWAKPKTTTEAINILLPKKYEIKYEPKEGDILKTQTYKPIGNAYKGEFTRQVIQTAEENPLKTATLSSLRGGTVLPKMLMASDISGQIYQGYQDVKGNKFDPEYLKSYGITQSTLDKGYTTSELDKVSGLANYYVSEINPIYGVMSPIKTGLYTSDNFRPFASVSEFVFGKLPGAGVSDYSKQRYADAQSYVYERLRQQGYSNDDATRMVYYGFKNMKKDVVQQFATYAYGGSLTNELAGELKVAAELKTPVFKGIVKSLAEGQKASIPRKIADMTGTIDPAKMRSRIITLKTMPLPGALEGLGFYGEQTQRVNKQGLTETEAVAAITGGAIFSTAFEGFRTGGMKKTAGPGPSVIEPEGPTFTRKTTVEGKVVKEKVPVKEFTEMPRTWREYVGHGLDTTEMWGDLTSSAKSKVKARVQTWSMPISKTGTQTQGQTQAQNKIQELAGVQTMTQSQPQSKPQPQPQTQPEVMPQTQVQPQDQIKDLIQSQPQPQPQPQTQVMPQVMSQTQTMVIPKLGPYFRLPWSAPGGAMVGKGNKGTKQWTVKNPVRDLGAEYFASMKSKQISIRGKI